MRVFRVGFCDKDVYFASGFHVRPQTTQIVQGIKTIGQKQLAAPDQALRQDLFQELLKSKEARLPVDGIIFWISQRRRNALKRNSDRRA